MLNSKFHHGNGSKKTGVKKSRFLYIVKQLTKISKEHCYCFHFVGQKL